MILMSSFFNVLKEDNPEGNISPDDYARMLRQREEKRLEAERLQAQEWQVPDTRTLNRDKKEKQYSKGLANEIELVVKRVIRNQQLLPVYFDLANKKLHLDDDSKRPIALRKFTEMARKRGHPKPLRNMLVKTHENKTYLKIWLTAIKDTFGPGGLDKTTLRNIKNYIRYPENYKASDAEKIIELNDQSKIKIRNYTIEIDKVKQDHDELVEDFEFKINTISRAETASKKLIDKARLLKLSIQRIEEGWDNRKQDRFWNNPETKKNIDAAFDKINNSVIEHKKAIKQSWVDLDDIWEAINLLEGKDGSKIKVDYAFEEIDPRVQTKFIEINNIRLSDFIESLGEKPERKEMEESEWKTKVQSILEGDEE